MILMRKLLASLVLALALSGCGGNPTVPTPVPVVQQTPLQRVTTALRQTEQSNLELSKAIISANNQGLISNNATGRIRDLSLRINLAGDKAEAITRNLATLPEGAKIDIWAVMKPVLQSVNESLQSGLIPITDANTRLTIQTLLTTIQGALGIIQVQVGGR